MATTDPVPVWPHKNGTVRGVAFYPLYPSVPEAASRSFVDALPGHLPGDVASQERLLELLGKLDLIAHCAWSHEWNWRVVDKLWEDPSSFSPR